MLAHLGEYLRFGILSDIIGHGEGSISAGTLGMHNPLGHPLSVKGRHFLQQLVILHQERTARARRQRILIVADRIPVSRCQLPSVTHCVSFLVNWRIAC